MLAKKNENSKKPLQCAPAERYIHTTYIQHVNVLDYFFSEKTKKKKSTTVSTRPFKVVFVYLFTVTARYIT